MQTSAQILGDFSRDILKLIHRKILFKMEIINKHSIKRSLLQNGSECTTVKQENKGSFISLDRKVGINIYSNS